VKYRRKTQNKTRNKEIDQKSCLLENAAYNATQRGNLLTIGRRVRIDITGDIL